MASQNPSSALDNLTSALKSNIIPNQEYLLQGSVIDSSAEVLLHRLRGKSSVIDQQ
jgi:mediator of RNA polymerase II transcription subunit 18